MKALSRINHIGLRVSDFDRSTAFYNKLGFETIAGPVGPEPVAILEHASGININLILNANQEETLNILMDVPTKHTGYTHVALEVDDADVALKALEALGIPLSAEPMEHPAGASLFVRDPDKNVVEFYAPK